MKVLEKNEGACIACHACESTCSKTWFKEENPKKSCIVIQEGAGTDGGHGIVACNQCGECIRVCPTQAISRDAKGIVRIEKRLCVGCFICVGFCPSYSMMVHKDHIEPFKCVACGQCVKVCPTNALSINENA